MTGFDCHTPIVVLTSDPYHDMSLEMVFESSYVDDGDDMGSLYFEDKQFELPPGISLTPDGNNLVLHGVSDEFCTFFVPVLAAWYPTAGDLLHLKGVGDSLYVTEFASDFVFLVSAVYFVFANVFLLSDAVIVLHGFTGFGKGTVDSFQGQKDSSAFYS